MFELAHSWGYPHPDLMLAQMTGIQAMEMFAFLNRAAKQKERAQTLANEAKLDAFFRSKVKK